MHIPKICLFVVVAATLVSAQMRKGNEIPKGVSLIQLISSPTEYDGKRVLAMGVLSLEKESSALCLAYEDYTHSMTYNSVSIQRNKAVEASCDEADGKYVVVEGEFHQPEPKEDSTGHIRNITRCSVWRNVKQPSRH